MGVSSSGHQGRAATKLISGHDDLSGAQAEKGFMGQVSLRGVNG